MKHIIIASIIMLMSFAELSAQPNQRMQSGDFEKFQIKLLIKQLEIESSKQADFEKLYTQYSVDLKEIRPKHKRVENPTNEQVEAQILDSFKMAEQATAIKKEYYIQFKKILSPIQILEMYNIERRFNERMNMEMQDRGNRAEREHGQRKAE